MKSRLTGGNRRKLIIAAYTIGTLINILSVGICAHTMYRYVIEVIVLVWMVKATFMAIVGIGYLAIEEHELHSNTDKY